MGEILEGDFRLKRHKPEGDISETPLGQFVINEIAKPTFRSAIDNAKQAIDSNYDMDLEAGDWAVVPLSDKKPEPPNLTVV